MRTLSIIILLAIVFFSGIRKPSGSSINREVTGQQDPYSMISEAENLLCDGDLVLRLNQDPLSQFIKNFNREDKKYSHAGIVLFENGKPFVYHILNDEGSRDGKIRQESFPGFCDPMKNYAFGVFRYRLGKEEVKKLKTVIYSWQKNKVLFDYDFNLQTDQRMYCSEMISKAITKATASRIVFKTTVVTKQEASLLAAYLKLPVSTFSLSEIVSLDNLYCSNTCAPVKEYSFNR